ncbi:5-phosphohydroxy-L-lysine phospho-lyase isoform X1 [Aplysia californica]|uniref:5-phosphohydroxy-L-lysine phospho-lyase isoform X1 n=2 Tax=Aplysia californica TaxID=6500 RepID=A0ABM0JS62_APLCA|nr:5-phosphohydroxy-L-lysine phospho-lyase isoform X1 [Aplysia californica]
MEHRMPEKPVTFRQTLQMRKDFVGKSCKLHFEVAPLKILRASRQYLYDDTGQEFLDCVNNTSHVGHCHPHVVGVGQEQMSKLASSYGFLNEQTALYAKRLVSTLPESLCVCFFVSSGSEGNDLALRLAASYTKRPDVICLDGAYHGNLGSLVEISPVRYKKLGQGHQKKDWVHIAPTPNVFRGKFGSNAANPGVLYANEVRKVIQKAEQQGRDIGAFISEPVISASGMVVPPENYFQNVYRYVRECGGICISDEVQCGLGRIGEHFWGFQMHNVVPDIVTIGKPIGNGYPLAAVITTKEIADSLGDFSSTFGGNPVACAIGRAVLDVIENEKLTSSAKNVGKCLKDGFKAIQPKHPMIGDVRGVGMMIGIELVMDKESKKPAKETAEILAYKLKEKKIIIGIEGGDKNVLVMLPPLCFTTDNARHVVQAFSEALANIESEAARVGLTNREEIVSDRPMDVPLDVITDQTTINVHNYSDDEDDAEDDDPVAKRARYEEVD